MQPKFYTLLIIGLLSFSARAQYVEAGIFAGVAEYNGDLSRNMIQFNQLHPAFGISAGIPAGDHLALRLSARFTEISGDDADVNKPAFEARNLDFHSDLIEAGLLLDFFILGFDPVNQKVLSPYLSSGLNVFHFNPQTEYKGQTYDLQPLGTEGQGTSAFPDRKPYPLTQLSIPMSAGLKWAITSRFNIAFEYTVVKTFTDYLDDISTTYVDPAVLIAENGTLANALSNRTGEYLNSEPLPYDESHPRGNPEFKDMYGYCGITFSYNFIFEKYAKSAAYSLNCPKF